MKNLDWLKIFQSYYNEKFKKNFENFYINPIYVGFKVTEICNQNCRHCWAGKSKEEMTYKKIIQAIDKISYFKPYLIGISGGEPFIRNDIFDILEYCVKKFPVIEVLTNGVLLNEFKIERLNAILRKTDILHFSLDGLNDTYKIQRGKDHFCDAINNLKLLISKNISVRVHMTITYINVKDMIEVYRLISNIGVKMFSVNYVYPLRKGEKFLKSKNSFSTIREYYENILRIKNINKNDDIDFTYFLPIEIQSKEATINIFKNETSRAILNYDILHWTIDANGDIYNFMDYYKFNDLKIGNIYTDKLEDIELNNNIIENKVLFRNLYDESCSRCSLFESCRGGDFINSYPNIKQKDKRCLIGRL